MPFYNDLRPDTDPAKQDYALIFPSLKTDIAMRKRTIQNLLSLREGLDNQITRKIADKNLIVASWNIKEFGHTKQRLPEAYFYMAEIINRFDLIAIQEVKTGLEDLYILMRLLGDDWAYQINDITEGKAGNAERSAYLYNKTRVELAGLAAEIVLWDKLTQHSEIKQLKRTPYMTGFNAGWKQFAMINIHLHPGDDQDDVLYRREEVSLLLQALKEKIRLGRIWNENLILAGDFNFYGGASKDDGTIQFIYDEGFKEVESIIGIDTNASMTDVYDRLFITSNDYFCLGSNAANQEQGGVFNPFAFVYQEADLLTYKSYMLDDYTGSKDLENQDNLMAYYKHPWRKNQLSDHFPIWFELIIDSSDIFLREKLEDHTP